MDGAEGLGPGVVRVERRVWVRVEGVEGVEEVQRGVHEVLRRRVGHYSPELEGWLVGGALHSCDPPLPPPP